MKKITYNAVFDILIDKMLHDQSLDVVSGWKVYEAYQKPTINVIRKKLAIPEQYREPAVSSFFFQKAVEYHNSHYELCRQYLLLLKLAYCKHLL